MVDANNNPIDTIGGVEDIDDMIKENGDLVQSYFYVYLYDLGFDINEYLTSEDATLSMKTGYCVTDFKIVEASPLKTTEPYYNEGCRWKFRLEKDVTSSANYVLPSGNVKPKKGDKFVLLYTLMPENYILQAEDRLEEAARKYLEENSKSKISYTVNLDEIYFANRPIIARALKEGVSVRVNDDELGDTQTEDGHCYTVKSVQSLVITYKAEQQLPSYQITLAEKIASNPINRIQNEVNENKENIINESTQNTVNRRNGIRNSRNLRALKDTIFDTDGYFNDEHLRPLSIETPYLAVGAKSRDFTTNGIDIKTYKDDDAFKVSLSTGYLNHRAYWWGGGDEAPIDVDKFTWGINDSLDMELPDNDKMYYIYIKAERASQLAEWYVSEEQLMFDFDINYYHFLIGVIFPVSNARRDISFKYGMSYITGGAIYGDVIKSINYVDDDSNEGSMYDLNNGKVRLGNTIKGLLIDIVNKTFKLFGVTLEFRNTNDEVVSKLDGDTGAAMFGKGNILLNADGSASFGAGKNLLNADGSGSLANGNISFGKTGNITVTGKYQSATNGNRFEIDPASQSLNMYDGNNNQIARFMFLENGLAVLNLMHSGSMGNQVTSLTALASTFTGSLTFSGIPASNSPSGLPSGTVYKDSNNTLKVAP
jgi:hypothetical protein